MSDSNQEQLTDGEEEHGETKAADPDAGGYSKGQKRPLDHGVKVRGKVKRGEDTRDQDELLIEGRGETAAEEREWADRLRALQPEEDEETEADDE